jgi:hypothetical protein
MNQFFSFDRFTLLVKKHWADNKKRYTLSVLAFAGLLIAWFSLSIIVGDEFGAMHKDLQQGTFFFLLFIIGSLYASQYFGEFGSKPKASNFLLVPASTFEKFLCSLLYTMLLFFVVFTAVFYLVDILMATIANSVAANNGPGTKVGVANIFTVVFVKVSGNRIINFSVFYVLLQSVFLLGSAYFRKYSFIKTIISCFVAWLLCMLVFYILNELLEVVGTDGMNAELMFILIAAVVPLTLWSLTYRRLKLKQV